MKPQDREERNKTKGNFFPGYPCFSFLSGIYPIRIDPLSVSFMGTQEYLCNPNGSSANELPSSMQHPAAMPQPAKSSHWPKKEPIHNEHLKIIHFQSPFPSVLSLDSITPCSVQIPLSDPVR